MPKYIVETISTFKMRYLVEADQPAYALDTVACDEGDEFDQIHLGEQIIGIIPASDDVDFWKFDAVLPLIDPEKEAQRLLKSSNSVIIPIDDNLEGC
ncbi:MAG: hypothetical protein QXN55_01380 [Candidatus Nitrosotenuis sp.]